MFENANKNGVSFREAHEERSQGFQDKSHLRGTPAPPDFYAQACLCGPNVDQKKDSPYLLLRKACRRSVLLLLHVAHHSRKSYCPRVLNIPIGLPLPTVHH